jgi:hypothetical protein
VRKQYHFWPGRRGLDAWDVDRLIELTVGLPTEEVDVAEIAEVDSVYWYGAADRPSVRSIVEHMRLVLTVDLRHPIILGPDGRVMDGMHRIARCLLEGDTTIRAVRLPVLPEPTFRDCSPDELPD